MGTFASAGPPPVESRLVVDGPTADGERKAITQAMCLLARLPERVAVIDAEEARSDVRATLLRLDAFTIKDSRVVYPVRQSALLQGAVQRQAFDTYALASVIWHEMAHLDERVDQVHRALPARAFGNPAVSPDLLPSCSRPFYLFPNGFAGTLRR